MAVETDSKTAQMFLEFSRHKLLDQYWPRLRECVESLTDEQVWWRPNETSNSIGNLVLHLNGNLTQWLVASFQGETDKRDRPAEFSRKDGLSRTELTSLLGAAVGRVAEVLARLTEADLQAEYDIQGYHVTGLHAVYQAVEHFGLHYGQIVYATKLLRDADAGFYSELTRTGRREEAEAKKLP